MSDRKVKAGKAYKRAVKGDASAQAALQRTRDRLQAIAQEMQRLEELPEVRAAKAEERELWHQLAEALDTALQETGEQLKAKHIQLPPNIEEWEHLAHIVEIPLETIRSGKLTAREIFACALGWADRQSIRARLIADDQAAFGEKTNAGRTVPETAHSSDFRSVRWFGKLYTFTTTQAACVEVLWRNWKQGTPVISEVTILDDAGSSGDRLRDVFEKGKHPAWGTMIVSTGKGAFGLADPEES